MRRLPPSWILPVVLLGACGDNSPARPKPTPVPIPIPGKPQPKPPEPTCLPKCAGSRAYDAKAYDLEAELDWTTRRIRARETISLVVAAGGSPIVTLDSEVAVSRVHAGETALAWSADGPTLRVDLTPLEPGAQEVTFAVEYEAEPSRAFFMIEPRKGDPAQSHVAYTISEPIYGSNWLIAKHDPSDRAEFSVTMTVPPDEDVIANGHRIFDDKVDGKRVVRYEMDRPLPTYLMAFAAGQLVHVDRETGGVPLSLWYRRGLLVDPAVNLDMVQRQMATFERLLGNYPFDTYAVVLVPEFIHGGVEHATVTFNRESSGMGYGDFGLNAHELAHHWFGDWVTMRSYDDVWVKEGMATLLAAEATRDGRDAERTGRLFGGDFSYWPYEAVVDRSLTGIAKYTSGPYQRAAWVITSIRHKVGEEAFWQTLRDVLDEYALDSIDGESFVRSFAPALDEATIAKILASLDEAAAPTIEVASLPNAAGTEVTFDLEDPSSVIIVPIAVTVVDAAGAATDHTLSADVPTTVTVPAGGYLALDERDLHPSWSRSFSVTTFWRDLAPLLVPTAPAALRAFETRSPSHQELGMSSAFLPVNSPDELAGVYQRLDSMVARQQAIYRACSQVTLLEDPSPWHATLTALLRHPPAPRFDLGAAGCGVALPSRILKPELVAFLDKQTAAGLARLDYLMSFDFGASDSLALIGRVATEAPEADFRGTALWRLAYQTGRNGYETIADDQRDAWKSFFRDRIAETTSPTGFFPIWYAVRNLKDTGALPAAAKLLREMHLPARSQQFFLCQAHALTAGDTAAWTAFTDALQPWTDLAPEAVAVLNDPNVCYQ